MQFSYSQFDPSFFHQLSMEKIMKLFLDLLTQTDGDVDQALDWLERLWKHHDFFGGKYTIEDFKKFLEEQGTIRAAAEGFELTGKGELQIRRAAFDDIFSTLRQDVMGQHRTPHEGLGGEKLPETRPFIYGDDVQDINFLRSFQNTLARAGDDLGRMNEEDLVVHEREHMASCATVLLLDVSHSMVLYGEDRFTPAKKVAMALTELITTQYPKDSLDVALFGDDAQVISLKELPYAKVGPFHTNTKAGLVAAQRILLHRKQANKQIVMITDGKPSCIWEGARLYKNPFGLDAKIVNQTINEAVACRRKSITITTFMITTDPYLRDFVDKLTKANNGRAYYADLDHLGSFVLTDYVRNKKKKV